VNHIIPPPGPAGIWRLLILSRDPQDPAWLLAAITSPAHIRPTVLDAVGRWTDWDLVTAWTAAKLGEPIELMPVTDPLVWTVRASGRRAQ
jgi:hypothetical protein